jgi:hypothetical protein
MDSYNEAKVKIVTLNGMMNNINFARGVKQGCPLSPVLFDICIDPLIEKFSSAQFKSDGFYWGYQKEDGVTAQAYADDILLFSGSYQGLTNLFNVVQDFIYESNIHLNTKKCEILRIGDDGQTSFEIKDLRTFETGNLNCEDGSKIIRYLGAPLGKGKITKMKSKATLIAESGLKTCQVIDAFKTFVIPMAKFLLPHSNISLIKLGALDVYLRSLINKLIGRLKVAKETFYLLERDGGFGLLSLKDRYHVCKIANMGHLLSSSLGDTYRRHITQVGIDRNWEMFHTIEEVATSRFFTWKTNENFEIEQMRGAPHCDPYEAFKACKFLGIGINYLNDDLQIF